MNRMLVVVFDNETAAYAGSRELRHMDSEGGITLYGLGVVAKDADGKMHTREMPDEGLSGAGVGLAVGGLIGLLGGPVGFAVGAIAGTWIGAVRDYWQAGVGLDFVEEANRFLQPGKVAVIAEVEEDWVIPVDARMEALSGVVFRRARADFAEVEFHKDIAAFKSDLAELRAEAKHATGAAQARLQAKVAATSASLELARKAALERVKALEKEADVRVKSLEQQLASAHGEVREQIRLRMERVRKGYDERTGKLKQAWDLTKEALLA